MKTEKILAVIILTGILSIPSLCMAGVLSNALRQWEPEGIYGRVMNVEKEIVTVREHRVMLVDEMIGRTRYKTSIMDINGNKLDTSSLRIGGYVVVKGTGAYDPGSKSNVIVAKEIYILPQQMNEDQMNLYPILSEIASPW
jgi:hypothetical protein